RLASPRASRARRARPHARRPGARAARLTRTSPGTWLAWGLPPAGPEGDSASGPSRAMPRVRFRARPAPAAIMDNAGSRIPGFYKLPLRERREVVCERAGVPLEELVRAVDGGGLDALMADKVVENVIGTYGLPFGIALNVRINGRDRLVPMVVEEPSVIAAASNAARRVRASGGFSAEVIEGLMIGQVQLTHVRSPALAIERLERESEALLALAARAVPGLVQRG